MSEDLSRDPLLGRLARFTPTLAGIDRDAMIFAAGRASASRARGWRVATAGLALSQAALLSVWIAGIPTSSPQPAEPQIAIEQPPVTSEPLHAASYANLVRQWEANGPPPVEVVADDPEPPHAILTIGASRQLFNID